MSLLTYGWGVYEVEQKKLNRMNRYKEMYYEQNKSRDANGMMQEELDFLFDLIHPYQHWIKAHDTTASVKRYFRNRYSNDINNYVKPQIADITPEF